MHAHPCTFLRWCLCMWPFSTARNGLTSQEYLQAGSNPIRLPHWRRTSQDCSILSSWPHRQRAMNLSLCSLCNSDFQFYKDCVCQLCKQRGSGRVGRFTPEVSDALSPASEQQRQGSHFKTGRRPFAVALPIRFKICFFSQAVL